MRQTKSPLFLRRCTDDLDRQRGHFGEANKRDEEDALCLAACYFDPQFIDENGSKRFLKYYYGEETIIARIREQFHDKGALPHVGAVTEIT